MKPFFKSWAAGGSASASTGMLGSSSPKKLSNLTGAGSLFMPLSDPGSIKITFVHYLFGLFAHSSASYPLVVPCASRWLWPHRSMPVMDLGESWPCIVVDLQPSYCHPASSEDLLVPYSDLLAFDDKSLQQRLGPFLEIHKHSRPSEDHARALIATLIRPEFNRAEAVIDAESRARIHPVLFEICEHTYEVITNSGDQLTTYQEYFNSLPRSVLECSARDHLLPEADLGSLQNRLHSIESESHNLASSLEQREQDCASLKRQISDLRGSHSWKITAPFRALVDFFRLAVR